MYRWIAVMLCSLAAGFASGTLARNAPAAAGDAARAAAEKAAEKKTTAVHPEYLDIRRTRPIAGDAAAGKAKAQVCVACHGESGFSTAPMFPNLRGQSAEYLYWALVEYKRARGPVSAMTPLMEPLGDRDMRDLAAFYAQASMEAASSAVTGEPSSQPAPDPQWLDAGERLFKEGDAARGVPPCQGCHGVDGAGHPLAKQAGSARLAAFYRTYPALRGQRPDYVVARLTQYREGQLHDSTHDFIMRSVAARLDDEAIRSVAAWVSSR